MPWYSTAAPDDAPDDVGPVVSPVTSSSHDALARFELESGKGKAGTKILMVEWSTASEPVAGAAATGPVPSPDHQEEQWDVLWPGKTIRRSAVLNERVDPATQRAYFLLPEKASVPDLVTITQRPDGRTLHVKPLPAIYPPQLGIDRSRDTGKRGVLHTIWAKKRIAELQEEIRREKAMNSETIDAALAERESKWIADQFGLVVTAEGGSTADAATIGAAPPTPQSPRSPVRGRMVEKLRGLKLVTSPSDLAQSPELYSPPSDASYIAVPSKTASAADTAKGRVGGPAAALGSLKAIVGDPPKTGSGAPKSKEAEEDLFALPMSARTPDMIKSPYSLL